MGAGPYANDSPRSPYISVDVTLDCGCEIRDRRTFAAQMKEQRGWDMATSGGWSISGAPGELTPAVAWLLSDGASYATGTAMRVVGGM